jgi:hypothetical protein
MTSIGTGPRATPLSNTLTIGFAPHRLEAIPFAAPLMTAHEVIFLEEPVTPGFDDMLAGALSVDRYVESSEAEFPRFAEASCRLLMTLHRQGRCVQQVDPYMDRLIAIHSFFADGGKPGQIRPESELGDVYQMEKQWSAALIGYYTDCLRAPFSAVVALLQRFARVDAARDRMRDRLRAQAIAARLNGFGSAYVEAGPLHVALHRELANVLPQAWRVRPVHVMAPVARALRGRREIFGPGEILTLSYAFRPDYHGPRSDLLAARSLVYVKILEKTELTGPEGSTPHAKDEARAAALVERLSYQDCGRLYPSLKKAPTAQARSLVYAYLGETG